MLKRYAAVLALTITTLGFAEPPPADIQEIFKKLHSGQQPSTDEQARLREWMTRKPGGAPGGASGAPGAPTIMPPDVAEIMRKAREEGIAPTGADKARLESWAAETRGQKAEILKNESQGAAALEASKPAQQRGSSDPDRGKLRGWVRITANQTVRNSNKRGDRNGTTTSSTTANYPVLWRIIEPVQGKDGKVIDGAFSLSMRLDPDRTANASFNQSVHTKEGTTTSDATLGGSGGATMPRAMLNGELAWAPGAQRPYLSLQASFMVAAHGTATTTTGSDSKTSTVDTDSAAPALDQISLDTYRTDVYWKQAFGILPGAAAKYGVAQMIPPEIQQAMQSATFSLNASALRNAITTGAEFKDMATYHYVIRHSGDDETSTIDQTTTIRFDAPPRENELVMYPVDQSAYDKFVPSMYTTDEKDAAIFGVKTKDPSMMLGFQLLLRTPSGAEGPKTKLEVRLKDTSKYKGKSTNWPTDGDELPDVSIASDEFNQDWVIDKDRQHAVTKNAVTQAVIKLVTQDPAAFTRLTAEAPEFGLHGEYKQASKQFIVVPRDDNENFIADQYEKDRGIENKSEDWDGDDTPSGQRNNGDGLTLFEEYRGFVVKKDQNSSDLTHVRTDPRVKDVFFWDKDGLVKKYAEPHNKETFGGLVFHYVDDKTMKWVGVPADPDHRRINLNSPDSKMYARQYGLYVLIDNTLKNGEGKPIDGQANFWKDPKGGAFIRSMRYCHEVRLSLLGSANKFQGLTGKNFGFSQSLVDTKFVEPERYNLVLHELAHAMGVHHHMPPGTKFETKAPAEWPETLASQYEGVRGCVMKYPDDDDIAKANQEKHWNSFFYLCRQGDTYTDARGKTVEGDHCFEQLNVKTSPGE